jgi:hypothetical protein
VRVCVHVRACVGVSVCERELVCRCARVCVCFRVCFRVCVRVCVSVRVVTVGGAGVGARVGDGWLCVCERGLLEMSQLEPSLKYVLCSVLRVCVHVRVARGTTSFRVRCATTQCWYTAHWLVWVYHSVCGVPLAGRAEAQSNRGEPAAGARRIAKAAQSSPSQPLHRAPTVGWGGGVDGREGGWSCG